MRYSLVLLALVLLALAATQPPPPPPTSPVYLEVVSQNLTLGHKGTVVLRVCNPSSLPVYYSTITMESDKAMITPAQVSVGLLRPKRCSQFAIYVIPLKEQVIVKYTISSATYASKVISYSKGSFALSAKAPKLVLTPVNVTEVGGKAALKMINVGNAQFKGIITLLSPIQETFKLKILPGRSATVYFNVPPMNPGKYSIKYVASYGAVQMRGTGTLTVFPSPQVRLSVGKYVTICFPKETLAVITIKAKNATPKPSRMTIKVKGCVRVGYKLLSPKLPVSVLVKAKIGMLTLNATASENSCAANLNTTVLWAGYDNYLKLNTSCLLPLAGNLTLVPSSGSVLPSTLPSKGGTFVWTLPSSVKKASLVVDIFGNRRSFDFDVVPFQPSLAVSVKPSTVTQGEVFKAEVCITNTWVKTLKNVQVSVSLGNWTTSTTFKSLRPKETKCLRGKVAAPWNSASMKATIKVVISTMTKTYTKRIAVVTSPYTASPAIITKTKSLNVGYSNATLVIKNIGRGLAKDATLQLSSQYLLYPTSVYLGTIPPGGKKVIKLKFFVPRGTKEVKLEVVLNYCSGPQGGTCSLKEFKKEFDFPVSRYVPPQLSIVLNKDIIKAGRVQNIKLKIVNTGGDSALHVTVVASAQGLSLYKNYFSIDSVPPGKAVELVLPAKALPEVKQAILNVKVRYSDSWGGSYESDRTFKITVKPRPLPRIGVNLLTPVSVVGKGELKLLVSNVGQVAAREVKLSLYASGFSILKSSFTLPVLGPGQSLTLRVPYKAASPTSGSLTVVVNYLNKTNIFNYKVKVVQGPVIDLQSFAVYPSKLFPGSTGVLAFTLVNDGDSEAVRVRVSVSVPGLKISGSAVTIPTLGVSRTVPMAFTLVVPPDAKPGTYKVLIKVQYYFKGMKYERTITESVIVYPRVQALTNVFTIKKEYVATLVIAIIVLLLLWKRRRRKKELVIEE